MDEPTASLSAHEVQELFKLVRDLKRQGVAILFVSHRMEEVFEIADKVTVFRDGRLISTRTRDEATPQRAIADMVGREIDLTKARTTCARNDVVLAVTDLGRQGVFEGVTFDLHRGEVLGFAGLIGAGRTDVGLERRAHTAHDHPRAQQATTSTSDWPASNPRPREPSSSTESP
jgi:rhamnose transport system ATP-binding protein